MLRISYVVNNTSIVTSAEMITGANKVIYEHANRLFERGHNVSIVSYGSKPKWFPVKAKIITVPSGKNLGDFVPDSEIIVCTSSYNALEVIKAAKKSNALPFYFFQDSLDMYDYGGNEKVLMQEKQAFFDAFNLPFYGIYCPSSRTQRLLTKQFGLAAVTIPNAVDSHIFNYKGKKVHEKTRMIILGTETVMLKGVSDIYEALGKVREKGYDFELIRVSGYEQFLFYFKCKYYTSPSQRKIAQLLNSSDILISASYCESFSLPPLEAMACGTAVITSNNDGVKSYARDGFNCRMFKKGNAAQLAKKIVELIENQKLRNRLTENGMKTAQGFGWKESIGQVEQMFVKALEADNRRYFKKLHNFPLPKDKKEKDNKNERIILAGEKQLLGLFLKNKLFLESQIRKNRDEKTNYFYLAQIYFNLAVYLISGRRALDNQIIGLLKKVKKIYREHLAGEQAYIKQAEWFVEHCDAFLLFKNVSLIKG